MVTILVYTMPQKTNSMTANHNCEVTSALGSARPDKISVQTNKERNINRTITERRIQCISPPKDKKGNTRLALSAKVSRQ